MKTRLLAQLIVAVLTSTTVADAATNTHSPNLVVQSPLDTPVLRQKDAVAMYLHYTGNNNALLCVEAEGGSKLTVLDVTDPAKIERIAEVPIAGASTFDFVRPIGSDSILVRYRDGSGDALLTFKHNKEPALVEAPALEGTEHSEPLGETGLLSISTQKAGEPISDPTYQVWDNSNVFHPKLLATISGVTQRLLNESTGTLFFLNKEGITITRRPRVEREHKLELIDANSN
jgi:hypothetical protein